MSNYNILSLNEYCLWHIYKYLDVIDLQQLARSSSELNTSLNNWSQSPDLFKNIQRIIVPISAQTELNVHIVDLYKLVRSQADVFKEALWSIFLSVCKQNASLTEIRIVQENDMFRRSHAEVLDQFLNILQHLPNLKRLSIMADFYSIREKLPLFTKLEELYLDVGLEAEELISCCKFNPNLRVLHIYNSNIYGNLLDIAKYCNTLEELWIQTKPNAEEYGPCAELPKLKSLIICGPHEAGTLHRPFHAMAKPMGDFNLHHLSIRNTIINFKETTKMSQIKSLVSLSCTFADALCVERLTLLKNLKELNILMKNDIQISRELLSIIRDCTKLEFLATERRNVSQNFLAEAHEVLRLIRNPDQDQPLKMLLIGYGRVSPVDRINDAYLQVL